MKLDIFALKDVKTDQFQNPMFLINKGQAVRALADEVNREDAQNILYKHPQDFGLYELGSFDTATGLFTTAAPQLIMFAAELLSEAAAKK